MNEQEKMPQRSYTTISPSAKSLLLMKALTNIPFTREAAQLMARPEEYNPAAVGKDIGFLVRVLHFENRYWSIDQLLTGTGITNILELSSGYSFRGLDMTRKQNVHYFDTDLPDVTAVKKDIIAELQKNTSHLQGLLEILPLNALQESEFENIVDKFPDGKIVIVNEGLMMYLGNEEKRKLCRIIHNILKRRGGYWITADIYVKKNYSGMRLNISEREKKFFEEHRIEENKFESFDAAERFFNTAGFIIEKEAEVDPSTLSSLQYLLRNVTDEQLAKIRSNGRIQATWRLKAV